MRFSCISIRRSKRLLSITGVRPSPGCSAPVCFSAPMLFRLGMTVRPWKAWTVESHARSTWRSREPALVMSRTRPPLTLKTSVAWLFHETEVRVVPGPADLVALTQLHMLDAVYLNTAGTRRDAARLPDDFASILPIQDDRAAIRRAFIFILCVPRDHKDAGAIPYRAFELKWRRGRRTDRPCSRGSRNP